MKIPEKIRKIMEQKRTIGFATCSKDNIPNCVPMLQYWWLGDQLVVGDLFMKATSRNVKETGLVSFCVWDDMGESYKFIGKAKYETSGAAYEFANSILHKTKPDKNFKGVVVIDIIEIYEAARNASAGNLLFSAEKE